MQQETNQNLHSHYKHPPEVQDFDKWLIDNQAALRKRLYRLRERRPQLIKVRDMVLICQIYKELAGSAVTEA